MKIRVLLIKLQGHSDILGDGNEIADKEAKQVACQMFKGNIASSDKCLLSVNEAYKMSSEIACKSTGVIIDFLAKNLRLSFFLTLLIMSVWLLKGLKLTPKHVIKSSGWRFCTGGSIPKVFP